MRRGRSTRTRSSIFPRGLGIRDISDAARARRRHRPTVGVHGRRAGDESARRPQAWRIPVHPARQPCRCGRHAHRRSRGAAPLHRRRRADLRADRRPASGKRRASGQIKEIPREGTLLPETYKFTRGMTREQIIQRMQREDQALLQEIVGAPHARSAGRRRRSNWSRSPRSSRRRPGRPDERSRVASVFVNRLKNKMRLQSDPTIIYGLIGGKGSLGRPIMKSEIEQPTPYNTYVIDGLPPGPIANPGRLRSRPPPIRRAPRTSISSPTAPAVTCSRKPTTSTRKTWRACGRSSRFRCGTASRTPRQRRQAAAGARSPIVPSLPCERGGAPLRSRNLRRFNSTRCKPDGLVEHDRLRSQPGRHRRLCLGLGTQIGQRQRASICGCGCRRAGMRSKCRRAPAPPISSSRGTVYANLTVERKGVTPAVKVNEPVLAAVLATLKSLSGKSRRRAADA